MRGAIFDLDGTLADTAADLLAAANAALAPHDLPLLDPVVDRVVAGRGGRSMIRRSLELAGRDPLGAEETKLTDRLYPELLEAYSGALSVHSQLYPGVVACLDRLEAADWRLGVCTNKPERLAMRLLQDLGVLHRFGALLGADTLSVHKPDPEHMAETARRIKATPTRSVMIGDTKTDLDTARNLGVPCILTTFGFAAEPISDLSPDELVDHFDEIPGVIERLMPATASAL